jgi:hypothetical protein
LIPFLTFLIPFLIPFLTLVSFWIWEMTFYILHLYYFEKNINLRI